MPRLRASLVAAATVVSSLALAAGPVAAANPVCAPPVPKDACGGRLFAEPLRSASALTYAQLVTGLEALADEHPDTVSFGPFGEGSADGNALYVLEVTAPRGTGVAYEDRAVVLVNQSIHGNEPGGREGAPRYAEDLAVALARDEVTDPRAALLDRVRLVQTFINPDGWASGDHDHVQDDGGLGLWVRQNGEGDVHLAGDLGSGIDLNRQAPWPGPSRRGPAPATAPEAQAYVTFVRELAAASDIRAAVDIHGEVPDAAALIMLSAGEYDLDEALGARAQGDAMVEDLFAELSDSQAAMLAEAIDGPPAGELIASSEFAGGGTDTGYFGDWVSMASGGDAASLSTIELYSFTGVAGVHSPVGAPGFSSLTARREVMQLYRDTVAGILGSLIDEAALEHDTTLAGTGPVGWVDAHERVTDPVRGTEISSARFYEELSAQAADGLVRIDPSVITQETLAGLDAVVVSRSGLAADSTAVLRDFVAAGGRVVLTDTGVDLADDLYGDDALAPSVRTDGDARVAIAPGELTEGVRDDAFMLVEPVTVGYNRSLAGRPDNVPTWTVDADAWAALGGSAEITADGAVAGGAAPLGAGTVALVGLLTPPVVADGPDPVDVGLEAHGVLDTGYIVLANALGGRLETVSSPLFGGVDPVGDLQVAGVAPAPAPTDGDGWPLSAVALAVLGALATIRARRHDG